MEADLPRGGDLFAAGLSHEGARTVRTPVRSACCLRAKTAVAPSQACSELSERLGLSVPAEVLINHPTISRLAEAVLQRGMVSRAAAGFSVASLIKSFMELQVARQVVDPRRSRPPNAARNPGRMVIVLAGPRSGSTLTQLVLNMHSQLYAGQELYLLPFFTMKERAERLGSRELSSWVFEGLRKTVMELRNCTIEEADDLLEQMTDFRTQDVLSILQAWAGDRILVDKTPPYIWSLDTLRRAEQLFEEVQYIHVYRHPYANISSMAAEAINRDFIAEAAGAASPAGWEQQVRSTPQPACIAQLVTDPALRFLHSSMTRCGAKRRRFGRKATPTCSTSSRSCLSRVASASRTRTCCARLTPPCAGCAASCGCLSRRRCARRTPPPTWRPLSRLLQAAWARATPSCGRTRASMRAWRTRGRRSRCRARFCLLPRTWPKSSATSCRPGRSPHCARARRLRWSA
jgi:hypothetical protein